VLRQPAASQVYLLQLTPARQAALTLLDQGDYNGHSYRGHHRTLFFLPGIISLFIKFVGIIRDNCLVLLEIILW